MSDEVVCGFGGTVAVTPDLVLWLLSAAVTVGLAGALLALGFTRTANRALALLLVLRGMLHFATAMAFLAPDADAARFWWRLLPYFLLPNGLVALYFISVYPRRRPWLPRAPFGALPFLAGAAALDLLYLADHALYWDVDAAGALRPDLLLAFDLATGPLYIVYGLVGLMYALVAVVAFREALRAASTPLGTAALWVSLGFGVGVVDAGARAFVVGNIPGGPSVALAIGVSLALVAALAVAAWRASRRAPDAALRARLRRYAVVLALPALSALLLAAFPPTSPTRTALWFGLTAAWRLALPVLVTFALLRYRLFDIEVKVKWTVKQSTVAAVFLGVFFVVSESAAQVFSASVGPFLGIGAAGLLVFALAPLQQAAERVAAAAVPDARPTRQLSLDHRARLYREQAEAAWDDGAITRKERLMLDRLREGLGLSAEEASRLERDAMAGS